MYIVWDVEEIESLYVSHISIEKVREEIIDSARNELSSFCNVYFVGRVKYKVVIRNGSAYGKSTTSFLN